jgi:hypothetical protein
MIPSEMTSALKAFSNAFGGPSAAEPAPAASAESAPVGQAVLAAADTDALPVADGAAEIAGLAATSDGAPVGEPAEVGGIEVGNGLAPAGAVGSADTGDAADGAEGPA